MPLEKLGPENREKFRPLVFLRDSGQDTDALYELSVRSSAAGVGGFIPMQRLETDLSDEEKTESLRNLYSKLLPIAKDRISPQSLFKAFANSKRAWYVCCIFADTLCRGDRFGCGGCGVGKYHTGAQTCTAYPLLLAG